MVPHFLQVLGTTGSATWHTTGLLCFEAILATLAVTGISFWWWKSSESARIRKIVRRDGPEGCLPTLAPVLPRWGIMGGHTLMIKPPEITAQLENWAKDFGGDYELFMFGKRVIVVTGLADIRRMLTLRPTKFGRGLKKGSYTWAATQAGVVPSMFFDEGREWGRSRRLISPNLNGHNVAAMLPHMSEIGERLCAKLGALADAGEVVETKNLFQRFTHDIIALAAFGVVVDSTNSTPERPCPSFDAMESLTTLFHDLTLNLIKRLGWKTLHSALPWVRLVKERSRRLDEVMQGAINTVRREANGNADGSVPPSGSDEPLPSGTLLRKIVTIEQGQTTSNRKTFTDEEVLHQAKSLLVAGTETTALSLSWVMYYLAVHPEAFARCRAEGIQAAPSSGGMVSTSEQLSQLVFCAAVFKEAVRLKPPAAFLLHHCIEDYTMKSGYQVEKGTAFFVLTRAASVSEHAFTRGAEFVPERWIEAEREKALLDESSGISDERSVHHDENAFLAFGGGPRVCPGQGMAHAEATLTIAAICARFDISLAPGQPDPPAEVDSFTLQPEAVHLVLSRREG